MTFPRLSSNVLQLGAVALSLDIFAVALPSRAARKPENVKVVKTPSVNVANTANVNVTSLPAVQLSGNTTINVKSDPITPLVIRDADNPRRNFFQQPFSFVVQDGSSGATVNLGTVPAGSTLVIEHII